MFFRQLRSSAWKKFFTYSYKPHHNIIRDSKFIENGVVATENLRIRYSENLKEMTLLELLSCIAENKILPRSSSTAIEESIEKVLEQIKELVSQQKGLLNDPNSIFMFISVLFTHWDTRHNFFDPDYINFVFDEAARRIEEFDVVQLGKLTVICNSLCDRHFEKFKKKLIEEVEKYESFKSVGYNGLNWVLRGLILRKKVWPKNSQIIFKNIYESIETVSMFSAKFCSLCLICGHCDDIEFPIEELISQKLMMAIDRDSNYFGIAERQSTVYFIFQVLNSLNDPEVTKAVLKRITNKYFIFNFLRPNGKRSKGIIKKRVFRIYLSLCEQYNILQPVFLDIILINIDLAFIKTESKQLTSYLNPIFYYLNYLNYSEKFKRKLHNKRLKESWESIVLKLKTAILSGDLSNFFDIDEEQELSKQSRKIIFLNYLWSLAYLNSYDETEIKTVIESEMFRNVKPEDYFDFLKMFQLDIWLGRQNPSGPRIAGLNKVKMDTFKKIFDSSTGALKETPVHLEIRKNLKRSQKKFVENYKNFPFFFDFADEEKKIGVVVDKPESLLSNDGKFELNGIQILNDRLAEDLGWRVIRFISSSSAESINLTPFF